MALKPLVFQVLLSLADGERHGWSLVREIQQRGDFDPIMPGNFYRTLRGMVAEGLIEEAAPGEKRGKDDAADERRRYFCLTADGSAAAIAEAKRLEALVAESRAKKLLTRRG
jgi:DNA-binding PadR family transcriptional regulator